MYKPVSPSPTSEKPKGKRGRPRLQRSVQYRTERRRAQVRDAQRTYRLKKESTIRCLEQRAVLFQSAVNGLQTLFQDLSEASMEIAIKNNNNELMQLFNKAGVKFEKIMAIIRDSDSKSSPRSSFQRSFSNIKALNSYQLPMDANSNMFSTSFSSFDSSSVPTNQNTIPQFLDHSKDLPPSMAISSNGFTDSVPQELLTTVNDTEDTSLLEMSSMKKPLENIYIQQQQRKQKSSQPLQWQSESFENKPFSDFGFNFINSNKPQYLPPSPQTNLNTPTLPYVDSAQTLPQSSISPPLNFQSTPKTFFGTTTTAPNMNIPPPNEDYQDLVSVSRANLQREVKKFLNTSDVVMRLPENLRSSIKELIFQMCLVRVLTLYSENKFCELELIFQNNFAKQEAYQIGRILRALQIGLTYTHSTWHGRTDDDSLFPGYCSPDSAEKYFYTAQKAGNRVNVNKFVSLVSSNSLYIGHMPRFALSEIQSAIVLATEF